MRRKPIFRKRQVNWNFICWVIFLALAPTLAIGAYAPSALLTFNNLSDLTDTSAARTNLGLGTSSTLASSAVFQVANNLSEGTASSMRTSLGLGTAAVKAASASGGTVASVTGSFTSGHVATFADTAGTIQDGGANTPYDPSSVAITGGTINAASVGATTQAAGKFTTLESTGILTTGSGIVRKIRVVTGAGTITAATTDDIIVVNKGTGASTVVNAPGSPTTGQTICVKDGKGDANTNNITWTPAAGNVDGAGTFVLNQNYQMNCFTYNATQWNVL